MPRGPEFNHRITSKDVPSSVAPMSPKELLAYGTASKPKEGKVIQSPTYNLEKKIQVETSDPLHLMIISNVFYGSKFCDVEAFEKHMQAAQSLENTRVIFLGNLISNPPGRNNVHTDVKSPAEQVDYMKEWIGTLDAQGKVLGAVRSDYPKAPIRAKDRVDDVNDVLFEGVSFPVMQNGGVLEVEFMDPAEKNKRKKSNSPVYRMGLFSKIGSSRADLNKNSGVKRAVLEKMAGNVDIAILGNPYTADVTQTMVGNPPTRQELTVITAGGYLGNVTGERSELTDLGARDKYAADGEPSGQVVTLYSKTKETSVYLKTSDFIHDYMVDKFSQSFDAIRDAGKEASFVRSLASKGIKLSDEEKQIIFQDRDYVKKLLEEQHHPQRRRT